MDTDSLLQFNGIWCKRNNKWRRQSGIAVTALMMGEQSQGTDNAQQWRHSTQFVSAYHISAGSCCIVADNSRPASTHHSRTLNIANVRLVTVCCTRYSLKGLVTKLCSSVHMGCPDLKKNLFTNPHPWNWSGVVAKWLRRRTPESGIDI